MMMRRLMLSGALAVACGIFAGCSTLGMAESRSTEDVQSGRTFAFEGNAYRIDRVEDEYVLMRRVDSDGSPGEITGWVKEVFRVSRYDLGSGRWYMYEGMPGAYLQWAGGDDFTIARNRDALAGAQVALLR